MICFQIRSGAVRGPDAQNELRLLKARSIRYLKFRASVGPPDTCRSIMPGGSEL